MSPASAPRRQPFGRPRDPALDRALLAAALRVLEQAGYGGFTIEAVARRAGTSKVTLYRRWPSAADLLLAALAESGAATVPAPTAGPLDHDLRQFFRAAFLQLNGRRGLLLRSLMAEAQRDEGFRGRFREVFIQRRRESLGSVLLAARDRGELPADADVELLLDYIFGAMWYRLLVGHGPLDDGLIAAYIGLVRRWGSAATSRDPRKAHPGPEARPRDRRRTAKARKPR